MLINALFCIHLSTGFKQKNRKILCVWYKYSQNSSNIEINLPEYVFNILSDIQSIGGRALIVGGAVRDAILGKKSKDIDFEVYRVSYEDLTNILNNYGKADLVGKAFGVIKFVGPDGADFDFSLPRTDSKSGVGHKDFDVTVSSDLTPAEAAGRRDFTINAISYDPLTHEIIDPYNGQLDLKNKVLRHVSDSFAEDPLRVLRGMNFVGRFSERICNECGNKMVLKSNNGTNKYICSSCGGSNFHYDGFNLAPETAELAKSIKDQYQHLPKERIEGEFKKLVQKGVEPGRALDYLYDTGWSENFPHIHNLQNVEQEPEYHPEIWLTDHTKYVMNEAARVADENDLSINDREVLIYAALAHDFAKPATTKIINKKGIDRITSHGHEEQGGPMAREFLESIGVNKTIIDQVVPLVENHLNHIHYSHSNNKDSFVKQLAERLHPSNIRMLHHLIESDHSGRPPLPKGVPSQAKEMVDHSNVHGVFNAKHPDFLQGRDVIEYTGRKGDAFVGNGLKEHRKKLLNHDQDMLDSQAARKWLDARMQKEVSLINGNDVMNILGIKGAGIKNVLNDAWSAQKQGAFYDKAGALKWLEGKI